MGERGRAMTEAALLARAVFFDRDGVLSESLYFDGKPRAPRQASDFALYPEASAACALLKAANWMLVVATNQPDIATGDLLESELDKMHARMAQILPLDAIEVCPHTDAAHCECRKPKPGMLIRAADRLGIDLARSVMVGDRWRDIAAGHAAGCSTILIERGWNEPNYVPPDITVTGVAEAAQEILTRFA
jgi:D-glycero-D-manno-heptose 1,7-bisphosphate phosphatase